ncbi:MAG TPA: molybdopterin dinucleotide binding domain-containing protein [Terriglobales bacterium]|nr:molybdopterin dinucleotide binding domain-containing protein [Terriglobales bacterium]
MLRRDFIKASTLAIAGTASEACRQQQQILPLLVPDPRLIPGRPQFFASVCRECPAGCGLVVKVNDGRPTKVEGNPDHPVNQGKLCLRGQTSVQGLYNPDRFRQPMARNARGQFEPISWPQALERFQTAAASAQGSIAWLGRLETGTLDRAIRSWLTSYGAPPPLYYEHFSYDALRHSFQITYGTPIVPTFRLDRARALVSFGADFLETYISNVEFAHQFSDIHSLAHTPTPAYFLAVAPRLDLTAASADEYWPARPGTEYLLAQALLALVTNRGLPAGLEQTEIPPDLIQRAARRLMDNRPSLVFGPGYANDSPTALACQIAVNQLNDALGNTGQTVLPDAPHALTGCATQAEVIELFQHRPRLLLLHHANPLYHHPSLSLGAPTFTVSFASTMDETTQFADLILPDHDFLESWGDYSPRADAPGILQPARIPLYDTRPTLEVLGQKPASYNDHELQRGLAAGAPSVAPPAAPARRNSASPAAAPNLAVAPAPDGEYVLIPFPTVQLFDGRQANRSWAQEIADPMSKIAWDGYCELHPDTAKRLGYEPNDIVRLRSAYGTAELPLYVSTWIRRDCVGALVGQGHSNYGMWANERGDNVHRLQNPAPSADGLWHAQSVTVTLEGSGKNRPLANLQTERLQRDKKLALALTTKEPEPPTTPAASFYHFHHPYVNHRWGMAIDLDSCIGCNACQAACYAENNIAIWGRSSALSHREMTWIRVELFEGDKDHPSTELHPDLRFLPIPCQQCGNAPCEYVCPTFAAYHTDEGLNGQVYNRCVGTRYCSNNCIYKVRRFNWYTPQWPEPLNQQLNPDVTVRAKGVMEKCTFCVQRITQVELDAETNHRPMRDGDIQTACQQTCPTNAIVFGDLLDSSSRVARLAADNRGYGLFADENTYPAVTYLKKKARRD